MSGFFFHRIKSKYYFLAEIIKNLFVFLLGVKKSCHVYKAVDKMNKRKRVLKIIRWHLAVAASSQSWWERTDKTTQLQQKTYPEAVQSLNSVKHSQTPALRIEDFIVCRNWYGWVLSPEKFFFPPFFFLNLMFGNSLRMHCAKKEHLSLKLFKVSKFG